MCFSILTTILNLCKQYERSSLVFFTNLVPAMRVKKTQYFTQFGFLNVNFVGTSGLWNRFTKILRLSNAINLCREVRISCQNLLILLCLSLMITLSTNYPYYAVAWHFTAFINFSVVYKTFYIYIEKLKCFCWQVLAPDVYQTHRTQFATPVQNTRSTSQSHEISKTAMRSC